MTGKASQTANATVVEAKIRVLVDVRELINEQLYLKLPDASEITIRRVDWDDTVEWLDNNLEQLPITVDVEVSE